MTQNIFVYHAEDTCARVIAALIQKMDSAREFEFLPIDSMIRAQRMQTFLEKKNLDPQQVRPPFLIIIAPHGGDRDEQRRVLYGPVFRGWLRDLLETVVQKTSHKRIVVLTDALRTEFDVLRDVLRMNLDPLIPTLVLQTFREETHTSMEDGPAIVETPEEENILVDTTPPVTRKARMDMPRGALRGRGARFPPGPERFRYKIASRRPFRLMVATR